MRRVFILTGLLLTLLSGAAEAAPCTRDDFAHAVDQAGAALRKLNTESTPQLRTKMRQLKEIKGWPDDSFEEKAVAALQDERIAAYDAQANELLAKLDTLGTVEANAEPDCSKLDALTAASLELQATVKAKTRYTLSKLDQMIAGDVAVGAAPAAAPAVPAVTSAPPPATAPEPKGKTVAEAHKAPPPTVAKKAPETSGWSTETKGEPRRDVAIAQPPAPPASVQSAPLPPPGPGAEEDGYTIDEIKAASADLFGKVSANLAAVIEHVYAKSGRPTGYVLGSEGGGAFLAGVRYGKGTLYMRAGGSQRIYWHGPSLGADVGADGSKTLFLIYKLNSPEQLYTNFSGVDGSAFLVGGVGATLATNGKVVLAPIRSGIGLRAGANIGYIRFTPHKTWNPF